MNRPFPLETQCIVPGLVVSGVVERERFGEAADFNRIEFLHRGRPDVRLAYRRRAERD
jgi:hypothetical protein